MRPATEADLPFLVALRRESMGPHVAAAGLDASAEAQLARVMHRFDCAQLVLADGQPAGLLKLAKAPREWTLLQLQVAADARGKGLGQQLIEGVLAEAAEAGVRVRLSVLKANPARRLYERLGFTVTGEDDLEFHMAAG